MGTKCNQQSTLSWYTIFQQFTILWLNKNYYHDLYLNNGTPKFIIITSSSLCFITFLTSIRSYG